MLVCLHTPVSWLSFGLVAVAAAGLTGLPTGRIGVMFVFSVEFFGHCRTLTGFAGLCSVVAIPRVWAKSALGRDRGWAGSGLP